ncbi:MAG: hypothetical protein K9G30_04335 [Parvibaculum sp.]|nr:hypothetical protein [Parvibaculum sp.]
MLKDDLRRILLDRVQTGTLATYKGLADSLKLEPPQTIHRVTEALEALMAEDAAAGRPLLAALCVSRLEPGLPARGFFIAAHALGLFTGEPDGPEASAFHAHELQRAVDFYRQSGPEVS